MAFLGISFLVIAMSYLVGSIPFGLIIGKLNKIDIRRHGSGNIGATNITRAIGRDWGIACFILDFLKGLIPVLIIRLINFDDAAIDNLLPLLAVAGTICGHIWPVFLKFKGGKGMSTSLGALTALAPLAVAIAMIGWYTVFKMYRYVSLASITAALLLPIGALFLSLISGYKVNAPTIILLAIICVVIIIRHKSNIHRLINGTENKFTQQSKDSKQ